MILVNYIDGEGREQIRLLCTGADYDAYYQETFSPEARELAIIGLALPRGTYAERRAALRDRAARIQDLISRAPGLFYSDVAVIGEWLEHNARALGLLKEFRENGII